jgi:hypothetical protein
MLQPVNSLNSELSGKLDTKSLIAERVRGEFREMPGLTLTPAQARRLWSLDGQTCDEVLAQLVDNGFLCRRANGAYGRTADMGARSLRMAKAGIEFLEINPSRRLLAGSRT